MTKNDIQQYLHPLLDRGKSIKIQKIYRLKEYQMAQINLTSEIPLNKLLDRNLSLCSNIASYPELLPKAAFELYN